MKHEVLLKRDDGTKVKINLSAYIDSYAQGAARYDVSILTCEKSKRTWKEVTDEDNYRYRSLGMEARRDWRLKRQLAVVSAEEINQAKLELWQKLKPQI